MFKQVLLATSMLVAAPALAQTASAPAQSSPGRAPLAATSDAQTTAAAPVQQQPQATANQAPTAPTATAQIAPAKTAPAQTAPAQPSTATAQADAQPVTGEAGVATAQATPGADAGTATAQAAPAGDAATVAADPAAQPTNEPTQVASIVDQEFGSYDKDGDGKLSQAEFGAWMVALKTKSDPATRADSPETKKWVGAAFAQADTDRNSGLTKTELTGFLSQGQS